MTARTLNDFWNYWRGLNGLPPLEPLPWPPEPLIPAAAVPIAPAQKPLIRPRQRRPRQVLGQVSGGERPCRCGATSFIIGKGAGPHGARLCCSSCGRLRRWIGRRELESA